MRDTIKYFPLVGPVFLVAAIVVFALSGESTFVGGLAALGVLVLIATPFHLNRVRRQAELLEIEMHNEELLVVIANNTSPD